MESSLRIYYRFAVRANGDVELLKHEILRQFKLFNPEFTTEERILHWPLDPEKVASTRELGYAIARDSDASPYLVLHELVVIYFGERLEELSENLHSDLLKKAVLVEIVSKRLGNIDFI